MFKKLKIGIDTLLFDSKNNKNVKDFNRISNWKELYNYIFEKSKINYID